MVGILCGNTCTSSGGPLEDLGGVLSHFPLGSQATVSREEAESGLHATSCSSSWKDATALPSPLHGCPCSQCLYSHDPKRLRVFLALLDSCSPVPGSVKQWCTGPPDREDVSLQAECALYFQEVAHVGPQPNPTFPGCSGTLRLGPDLGHWSMHSGRAHGSGRA